MKNEFGGYHASHDTGSIYLRYSVNLLRDIIVDLSKNGQIITIYISTRAMTENKDSDIKGMTLAEVELPSGFEFRNMTQMYEELKGYGVKVSLFSIYRFFLHQKIIIIAES